MSAKRQHRRRRMQDEPRYVIGMDAHSRKLAISIWDWSDRFNACMHRELKCIDIDSMIKTYERNVNIDSITIIESSTNSASLKKMLNAAGYRAEIVRADVIANKERKRRICDIRDAENLALAYIKGDIDEFVWTPSQEYTQYRDIMFAYRDTTKEMTRLSNRIWNMCSRKGYKLPIRNSTNKVSILREMIIETNIEGFAKEQLEMLLEDFDRLLQRKTELSRRIAEIVLSNPRMLRLLQLHGVNYKGAFALDAAVENPHRFSTASKLSAYGGFSPIVDSSGEEEEYAKRKGGLKKPLDGEGRRDVKFFFTEAGQTVLTSCANTKLGKWGWKMINRGKSRNKVVCAIGRKLLTYSWHILRGDSTPNRHSEEFFKRKMRTFYQTIGAKRMHELGYGTRNQFAEAQAKLVYGDLPMYTADSEEIADC
ncbi:MAG: transposase [Kiritimatiellae bacterium]|nr:transposase [Kiritimatiellia bacterium]